MPSLSAIRKAPDSFCIFSGRAPKSTSRDPVRGHGFRSSPDPKPAVAGLSHFVVHRQRRSELVEINSLLNTLAPNPDLVLAADIARHLVPTGLDALGGLLGSDVLVHDIGEVDAEDLTH